MTDPLTFDEAATGTAAPVELDRTPLEDLQYVGPSTATTLAAAGIEAADILERSVTYVELVNLGVGPGVAGHLRREYSLPWADEPIAGARLRRRASHIRHLRPGERSWIDESQMADGEGASNPDATTDAEAAWRDRSRPDAEPASPDEPVKDPDADRPDPAHTLEGPIDMDPPINPNNHTVPELEEAIDNITEPVALAAVLLAERAGDRRATAVETIEDRLRELGAEPGSGSSAESGPGEDWGGWSRPGRPGRPSVSFPDLEDLPSPAALGGAAGVADRLDAGLEALRRAPEEVTQTARRHHTRLRQLEADEWRRISVAILLGIVVFSAMMALVVAVQPAVGLPLGTLPLFAVTLVVGVIGLPLRWWDAPGGYGLTLATGLLGLVAVWLIAAGVVGPVSSGIPSVVLSAYGVLAAALVVTTYRT